MKGDDLQQNPERMKQFLKLVLETGQLNGAFVDTDLRHTWIHNTAPEPPEEEILGKTDADLFSEEMAEPTMNIKRKAIESASHVEEEFTFVKPWGQNRYKAAAKPIFDEGDAIEGAMFTAIDISEKYRFLERSSDAVYTVDSDWTITFWNSRMADRTGREPNEVVGKKLWETFGDSVPKTLEEKYRTAMETGEAVEFEHYLPDPFDYWIEVRVFPDDRGLTIYSRDITDRKEREERLESQRDTLDMLNQVLRHDIRNDLQQVLAYADLLADQVEDVDTSYLEKIHRNGEDAIELTNTAREITEVLYAEEERTKRVDLGKILEGEIDNLRDSYSQAVVHVDDPISNAVVLADDLLDSVFRNLLKNAVGHNDKEIPEITVSTEEREANVEIRIEDNGPGISDDMKEKIFEKGEKDTGSRGTGIGLYLVQTLVDNYGGEVWIEDNDPTGAVFVVVLSKVGAKPVTDS